MRDFWHCPVCKGNFDHGEPCDCEKKETDQQIQSRSKNPIVSLPVPRREVKTERRVACGCGR